MVRLSVFVRLLIIFSFLIFFPVAISYSSVCFDLVVVLVIDNVAILPLMMICLARSLVVVVVAADDVRWLNERHVHGQKLFDLSP